MSNLEQIKNRIYLFNSKNDIHQYKELLDIADKFINSFPYGIETQEELDLGIILIKELISISYIFSLKQYESDFDLEKEIRYKKIKIFKLCIPNSHQKLRGITELLLGMKENIVG